MCVCDNLSVCLCLSVCLSRSLSVCLSVCKSVCLSVCLSSVCLSVCLSLSLSLSLLLLLLLLLLSLSCSDLYLTSCFHSCMFTFDLFLLTRSHLHFKRCIISFRFTLILICHCLSIHITFYFFALFSALTRSGLRLIFVFTLQVYIPSLD